MSIIMRVCVRETQTHTHKDSNSNAHIMPLMVLRSKLGGNVSFSWLNATAHSISVSAKNDMAVENT